MIPATLRSAWLIGLLLALPAGITSAAPDGASAESPVLLIEQAADDLQRNLDGKHDYYSANAAELYSMIDEILLPRFDIEYAGKLVLGKQHWSSATPAQRERFVAAFYNFLVQTYAKGILELDQDRMQVMPEPKYSRDGSKAMVKTELIVSADDNVQVHYSVRRSDGRWKIYDVRIDGVSYIQNYRNQFDAEINAQGIDALIGRLERQAARAQAGSGTST